MQSDFDMMKLTVPIALHGVNAVGHESGNDLATAGRTIPWLQDEADVDAFGLWQVTYRDVIVLDAENRVFAVYNLSVHDLGNPANYDELKALILSAGE
jgi:hypothetical protein